MIKLLATDLDGTLLNENSEVSLKNKEALKKLTKAGVEVVFCSGRTYTELLEVFEMAEINVNAIDQNGAEFRNEKAESLITNPVGQRVVKMCHFLAEKYGIVALFHGKELTYTTYSKEALFNTFINYKNSTATIMSAENFERWYVKGYIYGASLEDILKEEILKVEFDYLDLAMQEKICHLLENEEVNLNTSDFLYMVEVNDIKATKGYMLKQYCRKNNINENDVYCFGDGLNDISMFELFNNSIAMGNAYPELKAKASYITDTNVNDGLAKAVDLILEGKL